MATMLSPDVLGHDAQKIIDTVRKKFADLFYTAKGCSTPQRVVGVLASGPTAIFVK